MEARPVDVLPLNLMGPVGMLEHVWVRRWYRSELEFYDATIWQGRDMSWWKLDNLIICVGFQNIYGSDLEGLVLEFDLEMF